MGSGSFINGEDCAKVGGTTKNCHNFPSERPWLKRSTNREPTRQPDGKLGKVLDKADRRSANFVIRKPQALQIKANETLTFPFILRTINNILNLLVASAFRNGNTYPKIYCYYLF